ncbi:hypothetical protein [Lacrimispora sp. JR3]|uniref:hypothetical protein n=1 Tax=Lacrimispora sinapis TaxID=3111456 RepID=UPI003747E39E
MKKELPYFHIEDSFGGNQDWFRDPMMHLGGCGAAAACDVCINAALHEKKEHLYPYEIQKLAKEDYIKFAMKMKPYLRPRIHGIDTLEIFMDGFKDYLNDVGDQDIKMTGCHGEVSAKEAAIEVKTQIDNGIPIPFLMLKHKNADYKDYVWHWFMLVGYEEFEDDFYVKAATYGGYRWISLYGLWNTGYERKGGMVLVKY